jgi:predicted transcriptional regulator of viral defense system
MDNQETNPDWDILFGIASSQEGYFTTRQAADAGYSTQLLFKHIRAGRAVRTRRGIYRLVHFPAGEHEDLAAAWLWSDRAGIISHHTALALHGLSDLLPGKVHLTLPLLWRKRRFRVPLGIVLHYADVPPEEQTWIGAEPITNPQRTLNDCADAALSPDLLRQATQQAIRRGLVKRDEIELVSEVLKPFGGIDV